MKTLPFRMPALATLAVTIAVAGVTASAQAYDGHQGDRIRQYQRGSLFDRLDINNNGEVSYREFSYRYGKSRKIAGLFHQLDRNDSGHLGQREVARGHDILMSMRMRG